MLPRMASAKIEEIVQLYRTLAQNPVLSSAMIVEATGNRINILSRWTQRNLERSLNQDFVQNHILDSHLSSISHGFPIDTTTELMSASTADEQRRAVLREAKLEKVTKQFLEIWDRQRLMKNYDLAALDVHGDVYTDSEFDAFSWSPDKTKVLYIAEKKLPKSEPFYKQKPQDKKEKEKQKKAEEDEEEVEEEDEEEEEEVSAGNEYIYKPSWGEQLVGKHRSVVVVLDTTADTISVLPGIPDDLSPGQVVWTKDSKSIVGVAWKHEPRHLGLIACTNRLSWIFLLKDGEYRKLSGDGHAVRCPRFSPDKKHLVWLEREAGGAHNNAHRLMYLNFENERQQADVLVDIIETCSPIKNTDRFYGLYGRLAERCWSDDSQYIFLSTPQQNNVRSYIVDTKTKTATEIQNGTSSLSILDVKNNVIAFHEQSLKQPAALSVGRFDPKVVSDGNIPRTTITTPLTIPNFENLTYEFTEYTYDNKDEIRHFNYIYFGPKTEAEKSVALIVQPHGGPHSNYVNAFSLDVALLASLGFAVVLVNYRGSTGMGSRNVEYLQGKVGDADVKDCVTATKEALKNYPWLDSERISISGASHGGFLVAHLSAQYPDLYKAVVAKNPVIDIAAMFTISDIPDCRNTLTKEEKIAYHHDVCAAVVSYDFDESKPMSEHDQITMLTKMFRSSPIIHVNRVKAPTLLCIGLNDLRVPHSQGTLWYQRLKAKNVKTKMLVYKDNHPLSSGTAEIDNVINACLWLLEHTSKNIGKDVVQE